VVDRNVAKICSAAVSKAIRRGAIPVRFVAVTCHDDLARWLAPDWVLDTATGELARGRLQRPPIRLTITRASRDSWNAFHRHHYLIVTLHPSAQCFLGTVNDQPAAFVAVLSFPHPNRSGWREHRAVCLPDFQGIGIGSAMSEFVASLFVATGKPYFSRSGHPAVIHHRARSPLWKMRRAPGMVSRMGRSAGDTKMGDTLSAERFTAGFEYVGTPRMREARGLGVIA